MKTFAAMLAAAVALASLSTAAQADPHHRRHHAQVCMVRHHHKVCHWVWR
jgi:hypothetical protein